MINSIFSSAYCPDLPNSKYECGNINCIKTCENYNETCHIVNIRCTDHCYCKPNYVLHENKCILIKDCPKPKGP